MTADLCGTCAHRSPLHRPHTLHAQVDGIGLLPGSAQVPAQVSTGPIGAPHRWGWVAKHTPRRSPGKKKTSNATPRQHVPSNPGAATPQPETPRRSQSPTSSTTTPTAARRHRLPRGRWRTRTVAAVIHPCTTAVIPDTDRTAPGT